MNTQSNAGPEPAVDTHGIAPAAMSQTRPLYWSVRRELWEHRSIYIAPLVVASFALFGSLISMIGLSERVQAGQHAAVFAPLSMAPAVIMFTTFLVGFFYALDALYGERRDRSDSLADALAPTQDALAPTQDGGRGRLPGRGSALPSPRLSLDPQKQQRDKPREREELPVHGPHGIRKR